MFATWRTRLPVLALLGLGLALQGPTSGVSEPEAGLRIHDAGAGQEALVRWAASRFQEAGLALPPLDVVLHADPAACDGNLGFFRATEGRVELCTSELSERTAKLTILHELAHARDRHALSEETREAFLELRGLSVWSSSDTAWRMRGEEQAAEVITWALMDQEVLDDEDPRLRAGPDGRGLRGPHRPVPGAPHHEQCQPVGVSEGKGGRDEHRGSSQLDAGTEAVPPDRVDRPGDRRGGPRGGLHRPRVQCPVGGEPAAPGKTGVVRYPSFTAEREGGGWSSREPAVRSLGWMEQARRAGFTGRLGGATP